VEADQNSERHPVHSGEIMPLSHHQHRSAIKSVFRNPSAKSQLALAAVARAVCIIAPLIGSTQAATHFFHQFGFQAARIAAYAVLLLTVVTYGFGVASFYRTKPHVGRYWLIPLLLAFFAAAGGFNLTATPWPKRNDLAKQELTTWDSRLFENQNPDGGIRTDIRPPGLTYSSGT
jgi:hypothetical protein